MHLLVSISSSLLPKAMHKHLGRALPAGVVLLVGACASCRDGSSVSAVLQDHKYPLPGTDVHSLEALVLAEDSWGKAEQQEQAGPILDPPAAHFSLGKPPMGLQSCHSNSYVPQGAALPTSLLHWQRRQHSSL